MISTSEFDVRLFDLRIVEKNIRKGLITRKDYERYLKSLEDRSEKTRPIPADGEKAAEAGSQVI